MATPVPTARVSVLDRAHAGTRVAVVTGPVALPGVDAARERLEAFARMGPATRIALAPDPARSRWRYDPDALTDAVVAAPAPADGVALLRSAASQAPFRATLAGDYLLTEHDHGIGEVQLALITHQLISGVVSPTPEMYRSISRVDDGLISAAARVFGGDPRRIRRVLAILDGLPERAAAPLPGAVGTGRDAGVAAPATTVEVAVLDEDSVARIRERRRRSGGTASLKTLVLCGLVRALAGVGVQIHSDIVIPVDLRRYLRRGVNPLGNFVTGLEFRHRPGDDPDDLQRALAETVLSGRPVAGALRSSGAAGAAMFARRGRFGRSRPGAGPARLLYSGVNEMPEFREFGWRDPAIGGHYARIDPATGADLTATSIELHGRVIVSVSFDPGHHRREVISAALQAFIEDPAFSSY